MSKFRFAPVINERGELDSLRQSGRRERMEYSERIIETVDRFREQCNCAQAVFSRYAEGMGISKEAAFRIAAGFGSGMSRTGNLCGAVAGAVMSIGLRYGAAEERTYALVSRFIEKFLERNDSIECRELLGYNIDAQAGIRRAYDEAGCAKLVRDAAEILEELFSMEPELDTALQHS